MLDTEIKLADVSGNTPLFSYSLSLYIHTYHGTALVCDTQENKSQIPIFHAKCFHCFGIKTDKEIKEGNREPTNKSTYQLIYKSAKTTQ